MDKEVIVRDGCDFDDRKTVCRETLDSREVRRESREAKVIAPVEEDDDLEDAKTVEIKDDKPLKVLFVASEVSPYIKSGGLGDVAGSLPIALRELGVDVRVVFPKYRSINFGRIKQLEYVDSFDMMLGWRKTGTSVYSIADAPVPTYLLENEYYFARDGLYGYGDDYERFAFFSKAVIEFLTAISFKPDVIHLNDWQTGPAAIYLRDVYRKFRFYSNTKSLFTIHNLQYQGIFGRGVLGGIDLNDGYCVSDKMEFHGNASFIKAGLTYADKVSTVSETYAKEIQTPSFGYGLDGLLRAREGDLYGIVNGIDNDHNDPAADRRIFANYDADNLDGKLQNKLRLQEALGLEQRADVPLFTCISRLVDQKGFDLIAGVMQELLSKDVQFALIGTGDGKYEQFFRHIAGNNKHKVSANIFFDERLAQKIYAAGDFFLMPSLFEPCGLGQLFAMRYGNVPVARKTGGLADTIQAYDYESGTGNGLLFEDYLLSGLMWGINEAIALYNNKEHMRNCVVNCMKSDYSWAVSARTYKELYEKIKRGE